MFALTPTLLLPSYAFANDVTRPILPETKAERSLVLRVTGVEHPYGVSGHTIYAAGTEDAPLSVACGCGRTPLRLCAIHLGIYLSGGHQDQQEQAGNSCKILVDRV